MEWYFNGIMDGYLDTLMDGWFEWFDGMDWTFIPDFVWPLRPCSRKGSLIIHEDIRMVPFSQHKHPLG